MTIKEKLITLFNYYEATRGVGHTTLMKDGFDNYPDKKILLTCHYSHSQQLKAKKDEIVTWNNMEKLRGHKRPLAIDNGTIIEILNETIGEIDRLEKEIERLKTPPRFLRFLMS